jgi:hypothetical protein
MTSSSFQPSACALAAHWSQNIKAASVNFCHRTGSKSPGGPEQSNLANGSAQARSSPAPYSSWAARTSQSATQPGSSRLSSSITEGLLAARTGVHLTTALLGPLN